MVPRWLPWVALVVVILLIMKNPEGFGDAIGAFLHGVGVLLGRIF